MPVDCASWDGGVNSGDRSVNRPPLAVVSQTARWFDRTLTG
ncbi:hypothetical protein [Baaleninema simplex]|nr:hypothetical protein [Baaleninema simplex]